VFLAGLALVGVGAAVAVGARLLNQEAPVSGVSNSLIVLVPDATAGGIRAIRPDGQIVGVVDGSTNGCGRHVLVADGSRIAYTFAEGLPIQIAPLDGSDPATIGSAQDFLGGAFSPDRTRYASLAGTSDRADLLIVSLLDGSETTVARDLHGVAELAWSVDDTLALGFTSETETGVDLIAADGSNHRPLVRAPGNGQRAQVTLLSWSPDGTRLAYSLFMEPYPDGSTWLVDIATGSSSLVATADGHPVSAWTVFANSEYFIWSPDGRLLTYPTSPYPSSVRYPANGEFALLDLASGESRIIPDAFYVPLWSPDGSRLAFLSQDATRLTTMRANLSGRIDQIVEVGARGIAWSPDSRQIAVLSARSLDLLDATGIEPPTRISNDVMDSWGCMTWSEFQAP
jgi:WD40 repeat protein